MSTTFIMNLEVGICKIAATPNYDRVKCLLTARDNQKCEIKKYTRNP